MLAFDVESTQVVAVIEIKHILVPTDGSENALRAAELAGKEARAHDARVTILVVHDKAPLALPGIAAAMLPGASYTPFPREDAVKHIEEHAQNEVLMPTQERVAGAPGGVERVQLWGKASKTICEYAEKNGVDLIVLGRRGQSGFDKLVLGGVSSQVVKHASCTVMIAA